MSFFFSHPFCRKWLWWWMFITRDPRGESLEPLLTSMVIHIKTIFFVFVLFLIFFFWKDKTFFFLVHEFLKHTKLFITYILCFWCFWCFLWVMNENHETWILSFCLVHEFLLRKERWLASPLSLWQRRDWPSGPEHIRLRLSTLGWI